MNWLAKCSLLLFGIIPAASAQDLLRATRSWDGGHIAYPAGKAEITSRILRIEAQQETPFHCHPAPTMGYVLSGTVEVETKSGKLARFSQGESVIEVMATLHRGKALGGPVEIVVFYAGSTDQPNTVVPEGDDLQGCVQ